MKRILSLLLLCGLCACSLSKEEKAKKLIKEQLRTSLHDYKSYESVKYSSLDSSFTDLSDQTDYQNAVDKMDEYKNEAQEKLEKAKSYADLSYFQSEAKYYLKKSVEAKDSLLFYLDSLKRMEAKFKPRFNGWKIEHSFRAKSLSGNLGINHYEYYFDSLLTKIIKREDVSESASEKD